MYSLPLIQVEVNPLAEDSQGVLMAADAKIGFDDNASFRHKDLHAKRDETQEDPREVAVNAMDTCMHPFFLLHVFKCVLREGERERERVKDFLFTHLLSLISLELVLNLSLLYPAN
jgi:hypothetical protein